eukprot:TRINITY_DN33948_c0_g1_i1.p1 TRINITY_DN33948_c0_g1~~TRINITY_DN33948_c0_g1_i1.p1  ORF type:complete len:598 (-),score=86.47 TRINITY_DN33948_c0_g1_i1:23-1780(-)
MDGPDALDRCLRDLTGICKRLSVNNATLTTECSALKKQIAALKSASLSTPTPTCSPHILMEELRDVDDSDEETREFTVGPETDDKDKQSVEYSGDKKSRPRKSMLTRSNTMGAARLGFTPEQTEGSDSSEFQLVKRGEHRKMLTEFVDELFANDTEDAVQPNGFLIWLHRAMTSLTFCVFCLLVILVNCIYTSIRIDYELYQSRRRIEGAPYDDDLVSHTAVDLGFTIWFILELSLRVAVKRSSFFFGKDRALNWLDVGAIVLEVINFFTPMLGAASSFRILRVFRTMRLARIVQTMSPLRYLRTMLFAIVNSFACLLWAFAMMALSIYLFSIVLGSAVTHYFTLCDLDDAGERARAMKVADHFGSIYSTMIALFASMTGGQDWMFYATELRNLPNGEEFFLLYCFFIFFCMVGVLNVINGIFVDNAVCTRTEDEVVENFRKEQNSVSENIRRIFNQSDTDSDGSITLTELEQQMKHPWVKAYFAGLDIDIREASIIFTLTDTDGNGYLSVDEFVTSVLKMKGSAKSVDILAMMFDHIQLSKSFHVLCAFLQDELGAIRQAVMPGASSSEDLLQELSQLGFKSKQ